MVVAVSAQPGPVECFVSESLLPLSVFRGQQSSLPHDHPDCEHNSQQKAGVFPTPRNTSQFTSNSCIFHRNVASVCVKQRFMRLKADTKVCSEGRHHSTHSLSIHITHGRMAHKTHYKLRVRSELTARSSRPHCKCASPHITCLVSTTGRSLHVSSPVQRRRVVRMSTYEATEATDARPQPRVATPHPPVFAPVFHDPSFDI